MKEMIVSFLKYTPLYIPLMDWLNRRVIASWERNGCPEPPPHSMKQLVIKKYAEKYNLECLIETGTFHGDMIEAMKRTFPKIYSIELSRYYFEKAQRKFKLDRNVELLFGDSGIVLGELLQTIKQPALFWLDGHYSEGMTAKGEKYTPIFEELHHILNHDEPRHVIIIDDARLFGTDPGYPTMEQLYGFISMQLNKVDTVIQFDCICLTPNK